MGYETLIAQGVQIASQQFDSMKVTVMHRAWIGDDGRGGEAFAAPVARRALVDPTKRQRVTASGSLVMTYATLTWLDPIPDTAPNSGKVRQQPIDPRDVFTLPDGGTAPIVQTGGFTSSLTNRGFINETILGSIVRGQ